MGTTLRKRFQSSTHTCSFSRRAARPSLESFLPISSALSTSLRGDIGNIRHARVEGAERWQRPRRPAGSPAPSQRETGAHWKRPVRETLNGRVPSVTGAPRGVLSPATVLVGPGRDL